MALAGIALFAEVAGVWAVAAASGWLFGVGAADVAVLPPAVLSGSEEFAFGVDCASGAAAGSLLVWIEVDCVSVAFFALLLAAGAGVASSTVAVAALFAFAVSWSVASAASDMPGIISWPAISALTPTRAILVLARCPVPLVGEQLRSR